MKVEIAMKILEKVKVKFLLWSFLEQHFHPYPPPTAPPCLELSNESWNLREILMESESWVLEDHIHLHPQLLISSLSITHKALLTSNSTFFFTILWSMGCDSKVRMRALLEVGIVVGRKKCTCNLLPASLYLHYSQWLFLIIQNFLLLHLHTRLWSSNPYLTTGLQGEQIFHLT